MREAAVNERAATQRTIESIERWLSHGFKAGYPPTLAVDLTDLLYTLRQVASRLDSMVAFKKGQPAAERELFRLRIEITNDLPMVFADIKKSIDSLIGPFD